MVRALKVYTLLFVCIFCYGIFHFQLKQERQIFLEHNFMDYTLPSQFTGPVSLEFKGLVSDFLLFKFMAFMGGRIEDISKNDPRYQDYTYQSLNAITDLDPYYWDAYLFSEMFLAWSGRAQDANKILEKARKYRENDYYPPYYIGFNYYYFLKDNKKASKYLMEASKLPGCPYYIASLAARLSLYSFQHRNGIVFLKEMLKNTKDKKAKKEFELRIATLEILEYLENKVTLYHSVYKKYPESLKKLVTSGLIDKIPDDPYKGKFMIMQNGRVYTTSKMLPY
ncbi:MAG: hypothetical protein KAQ72_02675 [Desulfobacula sp.]|nr:hypothetical protein [Desulfobacula sp.]